MRWAIVAGIVVVFLAGVVVGSGRGGGATAQETDSARIAVLETQVARQGYDIFVQGTRINLLEAQELPGKDPNAYWLGTTYTYDRTKYGFGMVCTIAQVGYQYALRCSRADPATLP